MTQRSEEPENESQSAGLVTPGAERASSETDGTDDRANVNVEITDSTGGSVTAAGRDVNQYNSRIDKLVVQIVDRTLATVQEYTSRERSRPSPDAPAIERAKDWFEFDLEQDEDKFYAIIVCLFEGVKLADFRVIYNLLLQRASASINGAESRSRSRFGRATKLSEQIEEIEEKHDTTIRFKDPGFGPALFEHLRAQYKEILLEDILPVLKQAVERYRYWEIRKKAGEAVAEIYKFSSFMVRDQILEPWAADGRAYVRAAVGYALGYLATDENYRKDVLKLLSDWSDQELSAPEDKIWLYRWTAASTYKQIGLIEADWVAEKVFGGLRKLAGYDDIRVADSVIHSLVALSLRKPLRDVLLTLKEWIEEGSGGSRTKAEPQVRCTVGILALMVISEVHLAIDRDKTEEDVNAHVENLFELVRQDEMARTNLWQLMVTAGIRSFEYRLTGPFFELVKRWTGYAADDPELRRTIANLLVDIYSGSRPNYKEKMFNRLSRWAEHSKDESLRVMAAETKAYIKRRELGDSGAAAPGDGRIVFGD